MNAPISVKDALTLLSMAIEDCDKAKPAPWTADGGVLFTPERMAVWNNDAAFIVLARATMRPTLKYLKEMLHRFGGSTPIEDGFFAYPPLSALMAHYDATRPDWRTR